MFEYNDVACAMMESGDGGGVYTGRDWGSQGTKDSWNLLRKLQYMDWQSDPWKSRDPWLVNMMENNPKLLTGTEFTGNLLPPASPWRTLVVEKTICGSRLDGYLIECPSKC